MLLLMLTCLAALEATYASDGDDAGTCSNKFNCEYQVLLKLVQLEQNAVKQDEKIVSLTHALNEAKDIVASLNISMIETKRTSQGSTYIRWGRTTCPGDAHLVYKGYAGGTHYQHSGSGANPLCLPTDPIFDKYQYGFQASGRVYGAEYQSDEYSTWKYLHDHDIPCAVCRTTRSDVLMVPAKNVCHEGYVLEYKGYLMADHYSHSSSEYICVDDKPETISGGHLDTDGKLFYFVESVCGALKCPPYKDGMELTCAVCSFSQVVDSTDLQPYAG